MSIQSITQQVQDTEQYRIRSSKSEHALQEHVLQEVKSSQTDEYDKANPVGESVEGIYSVSHDEDGNLKVKYTQPTEKSSQSESKAESKTQARNEPEKPSGAGAGGGTSSKTQARNESEKPSGAGAGGGTSSKTQARNEPEKPSGAGAGGGTSQASSSSDDEELEELKKQEEQLKAQLNRETDEGAKQALRIQLQSIEVQIALKSAGMKS